MEDHEALTRKLAATTDALTEIDRWAKAYPLAVFPEPDLQRAFIIHWHAVESRYRRFSAPGLWALQTRSWRRPKLQR